MKKTFLKQVTKRLMVMTALVMIGLAGMGQVTYFDTNNFFLNFFTDTGYSHYDWRYEPLKTDKERGNLNGDVMKIVTHITDKTGRGFGENFTDTTYYNANGNIEKIVALKKDEYNPSKKFRPDTWFYHYDSKGNLADYTKFSEVEMMNGMDQRKEIHTAIRNNQGKIIREETRNYSLNKAKQWEEFGTGSKVTWTFGYDANGNLASGKGPMDMTLTYQNGKLAKMQEGTFKPVTYTYDAAGRLTSFKYFMIDGMDEEEYNEISSTLTYNDHGDIIKGVKANWDCTSKWQRRRMNYSYTYTITYTYDEKGNWTKAVGYCKSGNDPRTLAFTITRAITYRTEKVVGDAFEVVDKMPSYPGGTQGLIAFLSQNVRYPEEAKKNKIEGRVLTQFIVEKDGSIADIKTLKSAHPLLDNEAIRVIKAMPKWEPGMKDGQVVRVKFSLPINFKEPEGTN